MEPSVDWASNPRGVPGASRRNWTRIPATFDGVRFPSPLISVTKCNLPQRQIAMDIQDLMELIAPPRVPFACGDPTQWNEFAEQYRLHLPADYRTLIAHYGTGGFLNFLGINSPFASRSALMAYHKREAAYYRDMQHVFPIYPEDSGLLCVGADENGDKLFWLMQGTPDKWPVVFFSSDFDAYELYDHNLTTFLVRWLRGAIEPNFIAPLRLLETRSFVFTPYAQ